MTSSCCKKERPFLFSKYSGAGNDFVMVDDRSSFMDSLLEKDPAFIAKISCRKNGIGADGVILLQKTANGHYRMRIFNADGSEAEMCGNGLRCYKKFAEECGVFDNPLHVQTFERELIAQSIGDEVTISLGHASIKEPNLLLSYNGHAFEADLIHTGVPHLICYVADVEAIDVEEVGAHFRTHPRFAPAGTNVDFVEYRSATPNIKIRTYERGVEAETWACGTGNAAAAISLSQRFLLAPPISLITRGGDRLTVDFRQEGGTIKDLTLTGKATKIYSGQMTITQMMIV